MVGTKNQRKVILLGTGGTIAGLSADPADNVGYLAAVVGVEDLLSTLSPALRGSLNLISEQVCQVDSKDMGFAIWARLARRVGHWLADPGVSGLVVTHGTDTLEETAYFLHLMFGAGKPVVLTCAMRPGSSLLRDGPQNLADAVIVASSAQARGVLLVCAGKVHGAGHVHKAHTYHLDAFSSGEAGPLGFVEEGVLRITRNWPDAPNGFDPEMLPTDRDWPRVEILSNHVQADGWMARTLLSAGGLDGVVVAGTGNGSLSEALEQALKRCQAAGVRVVRVSRCEDGPLLAAPRDAFAAESGLSAVKARVKLTLELMQEKWRPARKQASRRTGPAARGR